MAPSFFEINTYCDADNAPDLFRHGPEVRKVCQYCSKKNPFHRANTPQTSVEQVDLTSSPDARPPPKVAFKKEEAPRPTQRRSSSKPSTTESRAMTTHPPEYIHGEGERQRQESIRLAPSKKNRPSIIEPTLTLVLSVYRNVNNGGWLDQRVAKLIIVANDEYEYLDLIETCLDKLRAASRAVALPWLDGDLANWQLATQSHKEKGMGYPITVFY
jgi:hypothetical protein